VIQFIGRDDTHLPYDDNYYRLTEDMHTVIPDAIELAQWYHLAQID